MAMNGGAGQRLQMKHDRPTDPQFHSASPANASPHVFQPPMSNLSHPSAYQQMQHVSQSNGYNSSATEHAAANSVIPFDDPSQFQHQYYHPTSDFSPFINESDSTPQQSVSQAQPPLGRSQTSPHVAISPHPSTQFEDSGAMEASSTVSKVAAPRPSLQQAPQYLPPLYDAEASTIAQIEIPVATSTRSGQFSVIAPEKLAEIIPTHMFWDFANVVSVQTPQRYASTKNNFPKYEPRKSRNELRALAGGDPKSIVKLSKPTEKKKAKPKIRAPANVRVAEVELTDSEDSDSDGSGSEYGNSSEEEVEKPPFPPERPHDADAALEYDVVKSVWAPSRPPPGSDRIKSGLGSFYEVVKTFRDRWKTQQASLKEAQDLSKAGDVQILKSRMKRQRELMESICKVILKHGHPEIVRMLGEISAFLNLTYQLLLDRVKDDDYNSSFVDSYFEVLSRLETVSPEALAKSQMNKIVVRFLKRGSQKTRTFARKINENAEMVAKKSKATESKSSGPPAQNSRPSEVKESPKLVKADVAAAGVKRPRSGDAVAGHPSKKLASSKVTVPAPKKPAIDASTIAASLAKPKGNQVVAKPSSFMANLKSASKKAPAQEIAKQSSSQAVEVKSTVSIPAMAAKPSALSAFGQIMADLAKPKATKEVVKVDEGIPQETEEEKAKRLRKEKRRMLRVTFKDMPHLEEIRFFTHHPEEDVRPDQADTSDFEGVAGEGRALKKHLDRHVEEEELPEAESLSAWRTPTYVDNGDLPQESKERNLERFGGQQTFTSQERAEREQHESSTLMAVYTSRSEIPPSPKEPMDEDSYEYEPPVDFGTPPESVLAMTAPAQPSDPPQASEAGAPELSNLLSQLQQHSSTASQNDDYTNAPQQPMNQAPASNQSDLERVFAAYAAPQEPAPQQQQQQQQPQTVAQVPAANEIDSIIAQLQQSQNQQSSFQAPVAPAPSANDIRALLAALNQNGAAATPDPAQQQTQTQQQTLAGPYEDPARKRMREAEDEYNGSARQAYEPTNYDGANLERTNGNNNDHNNNDNNMNNNINKKKKTKWDPNQNNGKPMFVTTCRFWQEGRCLKGDKCTYKHY